jgi:hypothetical protein
MKPAREDFKYGFFMLTWWYPLIQKWRVELRDPLGNTVELLDTVRKDCVTRNQNRMRQRAERWFPEESITERDRKKVSKGVWQWFQ